MLFMVTRLWYRTKDLCWFWNQISLWNVSSASRSLFVDICRHGHFTLSGYPLIETKVFLVLKSTCLGLDMFFMLTHHWYRTKNNDFETKFLFEMHQVLQGHFLWLVFDTDQRIFDFKINFLSDFVSGASRLLIICRFRHVLYVDSPLIQNKNIYFETKFLFGMHQVLQGHFFVARGRHGHFE